MFKHIAEDRIRKSKGIYGSYSHTPGNDKLIKSEDGDGGDGNSNSDSDKDKKVIGKTKSGKPVHGTKKADHEDYKDFSKEDHKDAAEVHRKSNHKNSHIHAKHHDETADKMDDDKGSEEGKGSHDEIKKKGTSHLNDKQKKSFWGGYESHMAKKKEEYGDNFKEDDHHEDAVKEGAKKVDEDGGIMPKDEEDKPHN